MNEKFKKAKWILSTLKTAGFESVIVGGAVRDHYMGLVPQDMDIATQAKPEQVEEMFPQTISVGKQFGVILVIVDKEAFEVATFRKDFQYSDGRHPDKVEFASAKEDVLRRDFTINGLFWNPETNEIIDWVEGRKDIDRKIIRCIGNPYERFEEDQLRILRAIRFAANLDFEIDPQTWKAVCDPRFSLEKISSERIRVEFEKILTRSHAGKGLQLIQQSRLLKQVVCPLFYDENISLPGSLLQLFEGESFSQLEEVLALLYCGSGKLFYYQDNYYQRVSPSPLPQLKIFLKDMTFSNKITEGCLQILTVLSILFQEESWSVSLLRRQIGSPQGLAALKILKKMESLHPDCRRKSLDIERVLELYEGENLLPLPFITGRELLSQGFVQGPVFSSLLSELYDIQLSDQSADKEKLMALLEKMKKNTEK